MWHVYSWFDGDNDGQPWEQTPLGSGIWKPRECPKPQSILVALLIADVAPPTIELLSRMHWQQSSGRSLESNSSKRCKGCVKGIQVYHTHKCIYVQYICIVYVIYYCLTSRGENTIRIGTMYSHGCHQWFVGANPHLGQGTKTCSRPGR